MVVGTLWTLWILVQTGQLDPRCEWVEGGGDAVNAVNISANRSTRPPLWIWVEGGGDAERCEY